MSTLIDAVVAIAPFPFVAILALPVTRVRECFADVAENASFKSLSRVVFAHQDMRRSVGFGERSQRSSISVSSEYVRVFVIRAIASFWGLSFIACPCCPSKAKPMFASFSQAEATQADVVVAIVAASTVVVQLILNVLFATALA
jgi:hypothetical protein